MRSRVVLVLALVAAYAGAMRLTGFAQGGAAAQGQLSLGRDWAQDTAMKITEPFTLASVGPDCRTPVSDETSMKRVRSR